MTIDGSRRPRSPLAVRCVVVKVGSTSLVDEAGQVARTKLARVVRHLATATDGGGRSCVLVSSGAIASGLAPLGLTRRPKRLAGLQAAAAVGQSRLMAEYARLFARRGIVAAQVLLTQEDFVRRRHFVNAQRTFEHLLAAGVVPVVNENDTVATEEITFGDNDRLAALVAITVRADLLVLLSDVDGIYTRDPKRGKARLVPELLDPTEPLQIEASGARSGIGAGGMVSKLEAAAMATAAGIPTVVANAARRDVLARILAGEALGSWVPARAGRQRARKAWMAFAITPRGRVLVDAGAERALRESGRSLLAAGVTGVEGAFEPGDAVEVVGPAGLPFARGFSNYSAAQLIQAAGRSTRDLGSTGEGFDGEVIHRDELVLMAIGAGRGA